LGPYITYNEKTGSGKRISSIPHTELFEFVEKAIEKYRSAFTEEACYPVLRIDVFKRQDGRFVVNEVEHLEACIHPAVERGEALQWQAFLREFWKDQIEYMYNKFINSSRLN
jgi:hypothetical protein